MKEKKYLAIILIMIIIGIVYIIFFPNNSKTQASKNTFDKILDAGEINVCYLNYPPMSSFNQDTKKLEGHLIDTMDTIGKEAGLKINYIETSFSTFIIALQTGQCDISIVAAYKTIPRAKSIAFTRTLFYFGSSAIVQNGETRFKSLDDLNKKGIIIAVTQGEASQEFAKNYLPNAKLIVHTGEQAETFTYVLMGKADVALGDAYSVKMFAKIHNNESTDLFADKPFNLLPAAWSVRKGDTELLQFFDASLESLESTGALESFEKKHGAEWIHK